MSNGELNGSASGGSFDLDDLRSTDVAELAIVHPKTGEATTWIWTLAGPGHPRTIEAANISAREAMRVQRLREQAMVNRRKWIEPERTPDEMRRENAESFAIRVLDWTPVKLTGNDYPYSRENVVKLLLNPSFGKIYLQLLEYFNSDESFTKHSEMNSPTSPSASSD
jgi:hypothetical protein